MTHLRIARPSSSATAASAAPLAAGAIRTRRTMPAALGRRSQRACSHGRLRTHPWYILFPPLSPLLLWGFSLSKPFATQRQWVVLSHALNLYLPRSLSLSLYSFSHHLFVESLYRLHHRLQRRASALWYSAVHDNTSRGPHEPVAWPRLAAPQLSRQPAEPTGIER